MHSPSQVLRLFAQQADWTGFLLWSGILIVAVLLGLVVIIFVRRMLQDEQELPEDFTLHGLRKMLERGDISREEYDRARHAIISRVRPEDDAEEPDPAVLAVRQLKRRSDKEAPPDPPDDNIAEETRDEDRPQPPPA